MFFEKSSRKPRRIFVQESRIEVRFRRLHATRCMSLPTPASSPDGMKCNPGSLLVIRESRNTRRSFRATFLRDLECDDYQGFYFSPPLPPEEFEAGFL